MKDLFEDILKQIEIASWMLTIKWGLPDDVWLLERLPDVLALPLLMFFACLSTNTHRAHLYFKILGEVQDEAKLLHENKDLTPPWFPNQGIVFLGQEQESLCDGFDNYDSLSANVSQFQASFKYIFFTLV